MQDRDKCTAKLIMKKSNTSLKISVSMLVISLIVISVMSIIYMKQYYQMDKDFISNVAVHTIKIEQIKDSKLQSQRGAIREDISRIEEVLKSFDSEMKYKIMPCDKNITGIYINDGEMCVKLLSVDKDKSFLLGEDVTLNDNVLYTYDNKEDIGNNITLQCEKVDLENCTSYATFEMNMNVEIGVSKKSPLVLMGRSDVENEMLFYVTDVTFNDIMGQMIKNVEDIYNCEGSIINTDGIYLYLDDVTQVNKVSEYLEENGIYNTCTFEAFEDMGDSLGTTKIIFVIVEILILCMGIVQMYLSFNAFYKVQQKDMGILRYHGYTKERIYNMYSYNLNRTFYTIGLLVGGLTIIIGSIVLGIKHLSTIIALSLIVLLIVLLISMLIKISIIKRYAKKDILTLVKVTKEFQ